MITQKDLMFLLKLKILKESGSDISTVKKIVMLTGNTKGYVQKVLFSLQEKKYISTNENYEIDILIDTDKLVEDYLSAKRII